MIDEPMDLSDQRSDQRQGNPIVVAGSVRGTGHDEEGGSCEDAYAYDTLQSGGIAFAVADGAGSASHAATGAKVSTECVVNALVDGARRRSGAHGKRKPLEKKTWKELLKWALFRARISLDLLARTWETDKSAFSATMLAGVLLEDGELVYAQVGDGGIVAKRPEVSDPKHSGQGSSSLVAVTEPQGKYANETIFLTSPEARELQQVGISKGPVESIAVFTDGLTHMALDLKSDGSPRDSFLGELMRSNARLVAQEGADKASAALRTYLSSSEIRNRTRDDVTLLTAIRHSEVSNSEFEEPGARGSAHVGSEGETGPSRSEPPSEESTDSAGESASWTDEILSRIGQAYYGSGQKGF